MEKLVELIKKELKTVEEKGLTTGNLDTTNKMLEMLKNISEIEEDKKEGEYGMPRGYRDSNYRNYMDYSYQNSNRGYGERYQDDYARRGSNRGGSYNGYGQRMRDHMDRMAEGMDMYDYGRDRYQHSGDDSRLLEGLERMMYSFCMMIESAMDFAETPQEKEIIRKHIEKMRNI